MAEGRSPEESANDFQQRLKGMQQDLKTLQETFAIQAVDMPFTMSHWEAMKATYDYAKQVTTLQQDIESLKARMEALPETQALKQKQGVRY